MRTVFIGGCGRSGTTMLASMLGTHPAAVTAHEAPFKNLLLEPQAGPFDAGRAARAIAAHWRFRVWGMEPDEAALAHWSAAADPVDLLSRIVGRYADSIGKPEASVWIDHTTDNLRLAIRLKELVPDARFIHLVRDGRAVAASVLDLDWGPNNIIEAALWWVSNVGAGVIAEGYLGDSIRRVSYEALVSEPEATLRELCEFLKLDWDPAMLGAGDFRMAKYIANQHALVGRPAEASRAQAWRQRLSRRDIELFEAATKDLLPMLGYPLETGSLTANRTRGERMRTTLRTLLRRYAANPLRRRRRREAGLKGD